MEDAPHYKFELAVSVLDPFRDLPAGPLLDLYAKPPEPPGRSLRVPGVVFEALKSQSLLESTVFRDTMLLLINLLLLTKF